MQRYLIAVLTALFLTGSYRLYAHFVVPLTASTVAPAAPPLSGHSDFQPPIFKKVAEAYLADVAWTHSDAAWKWQRGEEAFLFAQDVRPEPGEGNLVRMDSLAMLWKDPRRPEDVPYRLIADSALIQFENSFFDSAIDLANAEPGRIVWASLEGEVRIDGPDGLSVDGRQFSFSEESAQLYSDYPVAFEYGPTPRDQTRISGTANQINISLTPSDEPVLGQDMPRVAGLSALMLRRNVKLDCSFVSGGTPQTAHITSAGPFEYDALKRTATFDTDVHLTRKTQRSGQSMTDELDCQWLEIEFEAEDGSPPTEDGFAAAFDGIRFRMMRAEGIPRRLGGQISNVVLKSEEHDLVATMQDLVYDALNRVAVMTDEWQVDVRRGDSRFRCPRMAITHNVDQKLERLACVGAGRVEFHDPRLGTLPIEASWTDRVDALPESGSDLHRIKLTGDVRFVLPQQMAIASQSLQLWVDMERAQSLTRGTDALQRPLPLKSVEASGTVQMVSDELIVKRAETITVDVQVGDVAHPQQQGIMQARSGDASPPEGSRPPWTVVSKSIHVDVVHDVVQGVLDVQAVDAAGDVQIATRIPGNSQGGYLEDGGELELHGVRIVAQNEGGSDQTVTLYGHVDEEGHVVSPASLRVGSTIIRGANLALHRAQNIVEINGPGDFRLPVRQDFDGNKLKKPATLEIVWKERMTFNGEQAEFFGLVTTSLLDQRENISQLHCAELAAGLSQRISFEDPNAERTELNLKWIEARHQVVLVAYEYAGNEVVGLRKGRLSRFHVDQATGRFNGQGPGKIEAWTFGDTVRFSPTARANAPAMTSDPKWRYTLVEFAGQIVGNLLNHDAEIQDRVELLSGPVPDPGVQINVNVLDERTEQASNTVFLACDRLRILQHSVGASDKRYTELFALGDPELQGQVFRAVADELSFDERLGRFVLRGIGRKATLYFQQTPDQPSQPSSHKMIEFIPSKRIISGDGSSGLGGGL